MITEHRSKKKIRYQIVKNKWKLYNHRQWFHWQSDYDLVISNCLLKNHEPFDKGNKKDEKKPDEIVTKKKQFKNLTN